MKSTKFYSFILIISFFVFSCSKENMEQSKLTPEIEVQDDSSVFVNGINQDYLLKYNITESQFRKEVENLKISSNRLKSTTPSPFENALGSIFFNIAQNPKQWFYGDLGISVDRGPFLDLGLSMDKFQWAVSILPTYSAEEVDGGNRFNYDLWNFRLNDVKMTSQTSCIIYISMNLQIRYYKKILWKFRKLQEMNGTANLSIPITFDTSSQQILIGENKRFRIPNPFIFGKTWLMDFEIKQASFSYDFLNQYYVDFKSLDLQYRGSTNYIKFGFTIKTENLINDVRDLVRNKFGISGNDY